MRNWPTLQILAQMDTALLRKRARCSLARVISQHAEIVFQSLETLNMQITHSKPYFILCICVILI